jgi:protoporphyrinogen oxidase
MQFVDHQSPMPQTPYAKNQDNSSHSNNNVIVMGAGPAGLTAAYELVKRHGVPTTVIEKDPVYVGGISRTAVYEGYRFDIGGHRFFSKSQEIEDLWSEILGDELLTRPRLSRIFYKGRYFDYPLKASNALFNLGPIETARCITSYALARLHPTRHPISFEDWTTNQFGKRLYQMFFKTYTEKVWGISTKELSADWAAQRIKGLNMVEAIKNALIPSKTKQGGALIKTLIEEFRYPRLGPGQMWERVQTILAQYGHPVVMGESVTTIRHNGHRVTAAVTRRTDGATRTYTGTHYISTLPIRELIYACDPALPAEIIRAADGLRYRDYLTVAMLVNKPDVFPDNWIYLHDPYVKAGRIQNYKNWSPAMVPDERRTCLGLEYFCFEGDGMWSMSDDDLVRFAGDELVSLKMCRPEDLAGGVVVRQPKAYPIYDDMYKEHLRVIRDYIDAHLPNLQLVGRNGMHHYNNQDHSMMTALCAARNIAINADLDPWNVNTDAEYHEGTRDGDDRSGRQMPMPIQQMAS